MSWEAGESSEQTERLEKAGSKLGASWNKGSKVGGWRKLGVSWSELGDWRELGVNWSKGSKLEQAGRLERAGSELGVSWSKGSKLGGWRELGASWSQLE